MCIMLRWPLFCPSSSVHSHGTFLVSACCSWQKGKNIDRTMEDSPLIGVLALQGAFEEHESCLQAVGCRTIQVRTSKDLEGLDALVLPGGESTAMGLIGNDIWKALQGFCKEKPTWGTCAGMILLADRAVGTSQVHEQALIGGVDIHVCRNYFGSQVDSFEMAIPGPPNSKDETYPGVFIRAPAILSAGEGVHVLGTVKAKPCRAAAATLKSDEAREVICAAKQDNILCTAFHPELTGDLRWHEYFRDMVKKR